MAIASSLLSNFVNFRPRGIEMVHAMVKHQVFRACTRNNWLISDDPGCTEPINDQAATNTSLLQLKSFDHFDLSTVNTKMLKNAVGVL